MVGSSNFSASAGALVRPFQMARGVALLLWLGFSAAFASTGFWVCPGNLLTNQLAPREAQAQGCRPLEPGGVSQAHGPGPEDAGGSAASPVAVPSTPPLPVNPPPAAPPPAGPAPATPVRRAAQQQRDDDARQILQAELGRTQARLQALSLQAADPQHAAALHRLRSDEAALLRELARLPR